MELSGYIDPETRAQVLREHYRCIGAKGGANRSAVMRRHIGIATAAQMWRVRRCRYGPTGISGEGHASRLRKAREHRERQEAGCAVT